MKKTLIASIVAAFALTYSANAITLTGFQPNVSGLPAQLDFEGFALGPGPVGPVAVLPGGGTLQYTSAVIISNIGTGQGALPFPTDNGKYLSVTAGGLANFLFTDDQSSFGFQWGSIDTFNLISFYLDGVLQNSFTGLQVVQNPVFANGNQGLNGSAYVTFGGGAFDQVVLTSTSNSFEIDNVSTSVPDGGMTVTLLGLSLSGLAYFRRKLA
jgi:hypothetical protein